MVCIEDNTSQSQPWRLEKSTITSFSPYLNYDPQILKQSQPEFIFPEGASKNRGRFEFAFSQIGSAVIVSLILSSKLAQYNFPEIKFMKLQMYIFLKILNH